jgi:hypothetical protein
VRLSSAAGGFSLVEAVVAVGVLALGCLAAAGALETSLRAEAVGQQRRDAGRLLDAETARLRALPFFSRTNGPGGEPASLLADVFPHARPDLNEPPQGFAGGSGSAVYVSDVRVEGFLLRRTATLLRDADAVTTPVPAVEVGGWAAWESERPPALVVEVRLEIVDARTHAPARRLVVRALRPLPTASAALLRFSRGPAVAHRDPSGGRGESVSAVS